MKLVYRDEKGAPLSNAEVDSNFNISSKYLETIAQTKSESAVDVFVYDTSKDSDGGAWRHRTQHTSWYNEPLNTSTRGSRKEFPAVAVIVAEADKVTIYDGDDPSLPMWMVITNYLTAIDITSVSALNGIIFTGCNASSSIGLYEWDFLKDRGGIWYTLGTRYSTTGIANRPTSGGGVWAAYYPGGYVAPGIVNEIVNDVAMTVLPDAPIDPATGLPIPTIAVATDGGVSVIKDDGTVVSTTIRTKIEDISWYGYDYLVSHRTVTSNYRTTIFTYDGNSIGISKEFGLYVTGYPNIFDKNAYSAVDSVASGGEINLPGYMRGSTLAKINYDKESPSDSMVAYTTSTYNTGWMNGDIKLATLSDTDDTDLVGSELIASGDFTGWTSDDTNVLNVEADGTVTVNDGNGTSIVYLDSPPIAVTAGKHYTITIEGSGAGTGIGFYSPSAGGGGGYSYARTVSFVAIGSSETLRILRYTNHVGTGTLTGISMQESEPDRSVNNNGLQVFGTVQKNPVATGADLVAYSGFSASNYLQQPYNSDLDFGTGDFCIMGWIKVPDTTGSYRSFERNHPSVFDASKRIIINVTAGSARVYAGASDIGSPVSANTWTNITILRKAGVFYLYVNGELKATQTNTQDLTLSGAVTRLGTGVQYSGSTHDMALFRISGTAPTAEQIKKIYEDEKVLFQENAKATLHGTSDAVTALAYDEDTGLLSVGTSSGRSDFRGLRRVNNTTDAVGVAISASNGLIVEE